MRRSALRFACIEMNVILEHLCLKKNLKILFQLKIPHDLVRVIDQMNYDVRMKAFQLFVYALV